MTTRFGDYELIEHLASGGMADVWLADRVAAEGVRKRVVVKRIKSDHADDDEFETMFLDEARIALQLSHPNIVQTFEFDRHDDEWFVAMELVDGPSLESVIDQQAALERPMDVAVACRIVTELLAALEYAHDFVDAEGTHLQIVHRDVTPSNVLLTSTGVVKLADFGVAKAQGRQTKTQTGAVKGKFGYLAPEQVQGGEVDPRTDVFAVGVVLYEALTAVAPFGTGLAGVHALLQGEVEPLSDHRSDLPVDVVHVVERAMKLDPEERWRSAREMREALEEACREHALIATLSDVQRVATGLGNAATRAMERPDALAETAAVAPPPEPDRRRSRGPAFLLGLLLGILILLGGTSLAFMTFHRGTDTGPTPTKPGEPSADPKEQGPGGVEESAKGDPSRTEKDRKKLEKEQKNRDEERRKKAEKASKEKAEKERKKLEEERKELEEERKKLEEERKRAEKKREEERKRLEKEEKERKKAKKRGRGKERGRGKGRGNPFK